MVSKTIRYNKLRMKLIDRKLSKADLRNTVGDVCEFIPVEQPEVDSE